MDERIGMHQLNGAGRRKDLIHRAAHRLGKAHDQYRAQPFSSSQKAVAHGFLENAVVGLLHKQLLQIALHNGLTAN